MLKNEKCFKLINIAGVLADLVNRSLLKDLRWSWIIEILFDPCLHIKSFEKKWIFSLWIPPLTQLWHLLLLSLSSTATRGQDLIIFYLCLHSLSLPIHFLPCTQDNICKLKIHSSPENRPMVVATQPYVFVKTHRTTHLPRVNVTLRKLHFRKPNLKILQ